MLKVLTPGAFVLGSGGLDQSGGGRDPGSGSGTRTPKTGGTGNPRGTKKKEGRRIGKEKVVEG